jgi:hypothetical protein
MNGSRQNPFRRPGVVVRAGYRPVVVFLTPDVPRWTPKTEADIQQAIAYGVFGESHWWDAKRQLNSSPKGNKAFAADLAAFAIDGGSLLIGLQEDKESDTFSLAPQPTANMPERIGSIATSAVDPPLFVVTTAIPSEQTGDDGAALGYLLVEVPPSARAPHQVDGVYYGRGDRQNIRLSDAEVQRHHALRGSLTPKGSALLASEVARDPIPRADRTGGHLYLVAEPLTAAPDVATRFLRDAKTRDWAFKCVTEDVSVIPPRDRDIPPSLMYLQQVEARSGGIAVTTAAVMGSGRKLTPRENDGYGNADDGLLDIELLRSGGIRVLVGRATMMHPGTRNHGCSISRWSTTPAGWSRVWERNGRARSSDFTAPGGLAVAGQEVASQLYELLTQPLF